MKSRDKLITSAPNGTAVDDYHGTPVPDPYRWLEDKSSPQVAEWTANQAARYERYMARVPQVELIRTRITKLLSLRTITDPWEVGCRLFYMMRDAETEQPLLMMKKRDVQSVLVDPNDDPSHLKTVRILQVSNNGGYLALGEKRGGEESCRVVFFDVNNTRMLYTAIPRGFVRGMAFSRDGCSVYHAHERLDQPAASRRSVLRHNFFTGEETEVFAVEGCTQIRVRIISGSDDDWMGYFVDDAVGRFRYYLHNPLREAVPTLIGDGEQIERLAFLRVGARCFAQVRTGGTKDKIVTFEAASPNPDRWEVLIPELPVDTVDCTMWQEALCVSRRVSNRLVTHVYNLDGNQIDEVEYPTCGSVELEMKRSPNQAGLFYTHSSITQPPVLRQYNLATRRHEIVLSEAIHKTSPHIETNDTLYVSHDGTQVPLFMAWDRSVAAAAPGPLILTGYGAFGVTLNPSYNSFVSFLLAQGCRLAVAGVRGGSEFGAAWHEAGKRKKKLNAVFDFISAAEWLIREGWTTPNQLAIFGGSSGGLLVAAATMQRPDLFGAVLCVAPLLDMLRYDKFDIGYRWVDEYGTAANAEDFETLHKYSPYHTIRHGSRYPPMLFTAGDRDTRCNPLHVRKMVARLQAESAPSNLVLADIVADRGHSATMPLTRRIRSLTDRVGFVCSELGIDLCRNFTEAESGQPDCETSPRGAQL